MTAVAINQDQEIASIIRSQIKVPVFWSIGARPATFAYIKNGFTFIAKPRHRIVRINITLNALDYYDIEVIRKTDGKVEKTLSNIPVDILNSTLLGLEEN